MAPSFQGQVALVTGGASGMGFAVAERLLELGAKVAIGDLNEAAVGKAAATLGEECLPVKVNIADESSVKEAVSQVEKTFGHLDLAVNSAGVQLACAPLVDLDVDNISRTIDINLKGLLYCLKHEVALIRKNKGNGGAIVNIASAAASQPLAFNGPYSASKAGVVAITKSVASEESSNGIRVNCLSPGYTDTPMMRGASIDENFAAKNTPIGRCGTTADIADLAIFLLDAKQIQGVDVPIDGGLLLGGMIKPPGY